MAEDLPAVEVVHLIGTGVVGRSRKVITVSDGRAFVIDAETHESSGSTVGPYFDLITRSFRVRH